MDAKEVLKDQAKQAIDREDFITAKALIDAIQAVTGPPTISAAPLPTEMQAGPRKLVYTGPPPTDPVIPPEEQPQATNFDIDRIAQMDEKDYKLHRK